MKAQIYNIQFWIQEARTDILRNVLGKFLTNSGFEIVHFIEHKAQYF